MRVGIVSGGFDPLHVGHLRMIEAARSVSDELVVIVNSDDWLVRKKGYALQDEETRAFILENIEGVTHVAIALDDDGTVCSTLEEIVSSGEHDGDFTFFNGGDRSSMSDVPEFEVCTRLGISMEFAAGGTEKIASSSELCSLMIIGHSRRLWGEYWVHHVSPKVVQKTLSVREGMSTSYQVHDKRSEFWHVVRGRGHVVLDGVVTELQTGQNVLIPMGCWHGLCAAPDQSIVVAEMQAGVCEEDNITRAEYPA